MSNVLTSKDYSLVLALHCCFSWVFLYKFLHKVLDGGEGEGEEQWKEFGEVGDGGDWLLNCYLILLLICYYKDARRKIVVVDANLAF